MASSALPPCFLLHLQSSPRKAPQTHADHTPPCSISTRHSWCFSDQLRSICHLHIIESFLSGQFRYRPKHKASLGFPKVRASPRKINGVIPSTWPHSPAPSRSSPQGSRAGVWLFRVALEPGTCLLNTGFMGPKVSISASGFGRCIASVADYNRECPCAGMSQTAF